MLLSSRFIRRSIVLLCAVTGVCAAQSSSQFQSVAQVQPTGGRVASFVTGTFQSPPQGTDFLYINAPVENNNPLSGLVLPPSVTAGELLNQGGAGFANLIENQIVFTNVSNVVAAVGNFAGFGAASYAFALTPAASVTTNLCIYAGTGAQPPPHGGGQSYDVGLSPTNYPPLGGKSGCMTLTPPALPGQPLLNPPQFGYIAAYPFVVGHAPQLIVEDTANNYLYVLSLANAQASGGVLTGVTVIDTIALTGRGAGGAGPIYIGDFNGDGNMDFIVNGQTGNTATVYFGGGATGSLTGPIQQYSFSHNIHSMLLQDMDGDGHLDMVVEGDNGVLEIHKGNADGTFQAVSEGGTAASPNGFAGNGGHLAAINPNTLDILTTTPIGMSLLRNQGSLSYALNTIYNIGPGRSSYSLGGFYGPGNLDLAVDSPEGVAIINGNSDGTFQASFAYAALAPGLSAVVGKFRNFANNPTGVQDVVVGTGATQAQLLTNNGNGTFSTFPGVVNTGSGPPNVPAGVWSNVSAGDFDGDQNLDLMYTLTGLPNPQVSGTFPLRYTQYGNGDGTFNPSGFDYKVTVAAGANTDGYFMESTVGDFNGDGVSDVAASDAFYNTLEVSGKGVRNAIGVSFINPDSSNSNFSQVAAGFFKIGRANQQDVIYEQGSIFLPYRNAQDTTGRNFTAMAAVSGPGAPLYASTVLLTDVDGDGNGDLVVVYFNGAGAPVGSGPVVGGQVDIWYGNGDGTFAATPQVLPLSRDYYLGAVADMNADGLSDLVLSDGSLVSILYNQGGRSFGTLQSNGQYSTEQHFLAGQGINSISLGDVNGDGTPDLIVANGGATISNPIALGGETAAALALTPNPDVNTGGITVLLNNILTSPVTGKLVATPEPSGLGAMFTLTATITPSAGVALPTGPVQFSIDGVAVGNAVFVVAGSGSSSASYPVPAGNVYAAGAHTIAADYLGDTANSPLTVTGTHMIANSATTSTLYLCVGPTASCPSNGSVVAPPMPPAYPTSLSMYYGQSYNGVLSTTANDGSALSPASAISFTDNYNGVTTTLCTLVIGSGAGGTCLPPVGDPGTTLTGINVFTGVYPGDATHTGSSSIPVTINVAPDTTTATLTGAPNPSPQGRPVTFTATVTGNFAAPTGPVVFTYGGTVLGPANLVAGAGLSSTATLTTTLLPQGTDVITATYAPTLNFNGASATFRETITASLAGSFTVTVTPTPVTVGVGYSTLLVVTVTPQNGFAKNVNLTCANLPSEASCFFDSPSIAAGGGTTNLVVGTTAPHTCGTTTPYFLGSNSGGGGPWPMGLGALAGVAMLFIPGKKRWLKAMMALAVVAAMTQMTGCGTCTDLGTRPATYTFQVVGTAAGSSATQTQIVTLTVTI
jgi:hypothetical protein